MDDTGGRCRISDVVNNSPAMCTQLSPPHCRGYLVSLVALTFLCLMLPQVPVSKDTWQLRQVKTMIFFVSYDIFSLHMYSKVINQRGQMPLYDYTSFPVYQLTQSNNKLFFLFCLRYFFIFVSFP